MMTEDELRDRLHAGSVGIQPSDGLVETLAHEHARRHKRARAGLIGGSLATTALVVAVLASLFTTTDPVLVVQPAASDDAEIINRAGQADKAAHNMIMHLKADTGLYVEPGLAGGTPLQAELWVLRAENRARILWPGKADTTIRPGLYESINFAARQAAYDDTYQPTGDIVSSLTGSALGGPEMWFQQGLRKVQHNGAEIGLIGEGSGMQVWVDAKTYLIKRAVFGGRTITVDWLPATAENRELLAHTVPADFVRVIK